jgi:adenylate cyclase
MTMDCTGSWKLVNCMACIKILEGIDTGKSFPIDQEIMLGRSANNDICLPDSRVSRQHARISLSASAFIIEDLQSSNGTLLRDSRIFPGTPYNLSHGDQIRIGSTLMVFWEEPEGDGTDLNPLVKDGAIQGEDDLKADFIEANDEPPADAPPQLLVPSQDQIRLWTESQRQKRDPLSLRLLSDDSAQHSVAVSLDASLTLAELSQDEQHEEGLHEKILKRLQAICRVSTALGTITEQEQLMQKIIECIFDIFPIADRAFILLREPDSQTLFPVVAKERHGEKPHEEIAISQTIVQEVVTHKRSILSVDAMDDDRFGGTESVMNLSIRSMMCAPLLVNDELLGLIQVDTHSQQQFISEDLQVLTGIGNQAAIAVKNAQLYEEIETETARRISLQRYFSPRLVDMMMSGDVTTALGGNNYHGTILFSDIIGFTTMSEAMSPADVLAKLNRYLTIMQTLIYENDGNVDKVNGDGIMAFWGVPNTGEQDERNAVYAALQMQRHLWAFNLDLTDEGQQPIHMGIGLNTGEFIAGNIGSQDKIEFTLIGDNVNLAARIESHAGRNQVLIAESTWEPIKHLVSAVQLPPLVVKGKSTPITVYSIRSMQNRQQGGYVMSLSCHILDEKGRHAGRGIITGCMRLNTGLCLRLSTPMPLERADVLNLQMETVEYHKPFLCTVKVHSALIGTHSGGSPYTKAVLTDIQDQDEEFSNFVTPGSCVGTTYTWNDLKRR